MCSFMLHMHVEWQKRMIIYFNIYSLNTARLEKTFERDIPVMVAAILYKSSRVTVGLSHSGTKQPKVRNNLDTTAKKALL